VEVVRAVLPSGATAVTKARRLLTRMHQLAVDRAVLDRAGTLPAAPRLRTLDAIHVATALLLRHELSALVTYDERMGSAAAALGLPVEAPA
jgi:predicted nucleic acid-binding protein